MALESLENLSRVMLTIPMAPGTVQGHRRN